jgi:U3 small nucleolar RNA-associated protein 15
MAAEVTKIPQVRVPAAPSPLTPDQRYWASFSTQQLLPVPNSAPITHLSTNSPALPSSYSITSSLSSPSSYIAVTTGPRLQLLSPQTLKVIRTIARTSSPFHGTDVRRDGRVVLTGSESGSIQAFDTSSRAILKTWTEHKQPVWVTKWHPRDLTTCMSASDDTTVRLWDLPSETSTWTGFGHDDYVRCGSFIGDGNLLVTGSYDQSIRIWDPRVSASTGKSCVMNFALPSPVEAVLALPGGTQLVGASGPSIAVLDLVAARPLHLLQNHQKSVTSLAIASQGKRLLSGALDGHVKVFNTDDWTVVAGFKHASPVLSLAVIGAGLHKDDRHLCVGMQSGLLSIRTRLSGTAKIAAKEKEAEMAAMLAGEVELYDKKKRKADAKKRGAGWDKRIRGKDYTGEGADIVIADGGRGSRPKGESAWEVALRRGRYSVALDKALEAGDSTVVYTCLTALTHRSAVRTALEGRNTLTLTPILRFLLKKISTGRFVRLMTDVALILLDLYGEHLGRSDEFDMMIESLHTEVRQGAEVAQMCLATAGMMELIQAGHPG